MKVRPEQLRLYAVTDRAWAEDEDAFLAQVEAAIDGGAAFVQLREKGVEIVVGPVRMGANTLYYIHDNSGNPIELMQRD